MKYRQKPVVIEARKFDSTDSIEELREWCGGNILKGYPFSVSENRSILIETLEGNMKAELGDYIIKGVQGGFYPCKPDIFEATYEPVEESYEDTV